MIAAMWRGRVLGEVVRRSSAPPARTSPHAMLTDSQPWPQENDFFTMTFHYGVLAFLWELTF